MAKSKTYKELALEFKNTKSERVYTELYKKMKPGLWSYINNIVKDTIAADDITSNTLTTVYLKIDQYNESYQITTWAYRIAFNECIGWLRARNQKISMNVFIDAGIEPLAKDTQLDYGSYIKTEEDYIEEDYALDEQVRLTKEAINALPPMYKKYMIERFIHNKSYSDILDMMAEYENDISLQTVKNRIFRGRQIIKNQLKNMKLFADHQYI
jgi:RNA polymerase sigma-70 factor (ECF subfamily)